MTTLYHVTRERYDGGDVVSLLTAVERGDVAVDDAVETVVERWGMTEDQAAAYLYEDGAQVHLHETMEQAVDFRAEYARGGSVLAIESDGLDVRVGSEYPHPVVLGSIPASYVSEVI